MLIDADLVDRIDTLEERVAASCLADWQERECVWAVEYAIIAGREATSRQSERLRQSDLDRAHYYLDRLELALEGIRYFHEDPETDSRHISHQAAVFLAAKDAERKAAPA